ncbi:hypothetical protein B0H15DRAFT_303484 [Mycena belliarum]|uniref:DUF6534 domain-containing protein n=1 Tax=Mycena belliarum TaxID=1033014 RepID=A0AAD6U7C7_9AGAR|nr:hypothetical protein B0H15DRAFT_303484 [Mycena belliae]
MPTFNLNLILGPIINGAFFTVFFFGLICMQTINYLRLYPNDILLIKCTVLFLWILQLAYTICICQGAYTMSVTDFGQIFSLLYTPWGLNIAVVIGSLVDHSVQAFFVARIYKATGALYLSIFLWLTVAFLQGVSLMLAAEAIMSDSITLVGEKWQWLLTVLFFGDASLDILNACVLCYYLKVQSRTTFSQTTAALIDQLILYTLQTGLITSFVALGAAIAFRVAPKDYIWTAFFMAMPGSFLSALLANINNRKSLVSQPGSAIGSNIHTQAHGSQGGTIQFTRNVVYDIGPATEIKSENDDVPDGSIELAKIARRGIYGNTDVV